MATKSRSLKDRIRRVIVLASLTALLATAAAFVLYDVISFKRELVRHLSTVAAVVADNVRIPLVFENADNARDILSALKAEPGLEAAAVYGTNHVLLASFPPQLDTNTLPSQISVGSQIVGKSVVLFVPVQQENKTVGTLYLRASLGDLDRRLKRYSGIVFILLSLLVAGAYIFSSLLEKRISRPILALSQAAEKVAESEDYSVRAPKLTDDELGALADTFNRMLAETQAHLARLAEQARLLDLSNDAIIVRDPAGRILYWNRGAIEIYGWTREEALGKIKHELLHTTFPIPLDQVLRILFRENRWQGELIQTRRDGARIYVSTRWALDRDAHGHPANVLISDNDITERKLAEEALREKETLYRTLGDNIPQLAWMANDHGEIFWYNKRWCDYTGASFDEMKIAGAYAFLHPDQVEPVRAKWNDHLRRGEQWEDTFLLRRHDGEYRWFLSRAFPIRNTQGEIVRWFGANTDITEQKLSEKQLERLVTERTARLQETIGELEAFSYSISHDMRAPLRAMQGYSKALLDDYKEKLDDKAQRFLERIVAASERLDLLIQDVLAYSKVTKEQIDLHPVDFARLIEEILPSHPELQPPHARVIIEKPIPLICGHEAYLTQCATNLLGNAAKFVPAGRTPEIRIRAESLDDHVRIWFEDNGIGIDPAHFQRIFEIFGQVYGEKKYGGTGIGLAIVRKAVQRMNGEVGVESEYGQGSRFWIKLRRA